MQIQVINLENGKKRIIHGQYANAFKLDYTQSLTKLKEDIEFALIILRRRSKDGSVFGEKSGFFQKAPNLRVHQGSNHLDIIDDGVGSMEWLTIEDHG